MLALLTLTRYASTSRATDTEQCCCGCLTCHRPVALLLIGPQSLGTSVLAACCTGLQGKRNVDPSWAKEYNPHAADSAEAIKERAMSGGQPIRATTDEGQSIDEWVATFQEEAEELVAQPFGAALLEVVGRVYDRRAEIWLGEQASWGSAAWRAGLAREFEETGECYRTAATPNLDSHANTHA